MVVKLDIEIVSDVICPWCFIGKRRFEKALRLLPAEIETEVHWRPFELNPDMPAEGMERKLYRTRKFGSWERSQALDAQLVEAGLGEGIHFAFDRMQRTPNTFETHRLIWLAGRQGVQEALVEGLFRAYFLEARDIGDRTVLSEVAAGVGLNFESEDAAREVRAEEERARRRGIQGVPFFIIGGGAQTISGAQKPETMAAAMRSALTAPGAPDLLDHGKTTGLDVIQD